MSKYVIMITDTNMASGKMSFLIQYTKLALASFTKC